VMTRANTSKLRRMPYPITKFAPASAAAANSPDSMTMFRIAQSIRYEFRQGINRRVARAPTRRCYVVDKTKERIKPGRRTRV
jgi:hypothetical protein